MSVADIVTARLRNANQRFFANDNISSFLQGAELVALEDELAEKFKSVLETLIIDIENDPNSKETPRRLAKMYLHEIMRGRYYPGPKITAFPADRGQTDVEDSDEDNTHFHYTGLLVIRADIKSVCSHHHAAVTGTAYIGIIPGDHVLGLSKYIRIAQHLARRGTLQEQLTQDILKAIQEESKTMDVAVYIEARHGCVENRGVNASNSLTQTTELGGAFYAEQELRAEFLSNIQLQKGK